MQATTQATTQGQQAGTATLERLYHEALSGVPPSAPTPPNNAAPTPQAPATAGHGEVLHHAPLTGSAAAPTPAVPPPTALDPLGGPAAVTAEEATRALVAADGNPRLAVETLNSRPPSAGAMPHQGRATVEGLLLAVASSPNHTAQLIRALRLRATLTAHFTTSLAQMAAMQALGRPGELGGLEPYQATKTYTNLLGELQALTDPHESQQTIDVHSYTWEQVPAEYRERLLALRAAAHQAPGQQQLGAPTLMLTLAGAEAPPTGGGPADTSALEGIAPGGSPAPPVVVDLAATDYVTVLMDPNLFPQAPQVEPTPQTEAAPAPA